MKKRQAWNTITLFCILIFGFTLASIVKPDTKYSETENRSLAQMPKVSAETILNGEFETDYENYLTDQFLLRDQWIGLKTDAERLLQKTESKDIYFAKDDYLIEKHTGTFTSAQAQQNIVSLAQFMDKELAEGTFEAGHVTAMVVPNAVDILRDKLPNFAAPFDEETYLAQIAQALPEGVWFDTSSVLNEHKEEELYYHTDHHWKTRAAFYVYQKWAHEQGLTVPTEDDYSIETVTTEFEGTIQSKLGIHTVCDSIELYLQKNDPFYTVEDGQSQEKEYSLYDYTALDTKDKYAVYFGGNKALVKIATKAESDRRILVIKDSYAHCFIPFMLNDFKEIDVLDVRYYNQKVSDLIAEGGYTDLLFLYNASGFAEDTGLAKLGI